MPNDTHVSLGSLQESLPSAPARLPTSQAPTAPSTPAPPLESEDDDPSLAIPEGQTCRRRGCGQTYSGDKSREGEKCVHHPGIPIFHEGSKGYSCCKRRVLEFDQFLKLEGCKTKDRHLFIGSGKKEGEEKVDTVRSVALSAIPQPKQFITNPHPDTTSTKPPPPSSPPSSSRKSTRRNQPSPSKKRASSSTSARKIASATRPSSHCTLASSPRRANTGFWAQR